MKRIVYLGGILSHVILGGALFSPHALADEIRGRLLINGTGEESSAPEMARIEVLVTSMCYETSRAAKEANALLANKIIEAMRSFALTPRDQITANPGPNLRQTEQIRDEEHVRTLCERKWRATNRLILKTGDISKLPEAQDALLLAMEAAQSIDPERKAQTFADLGQPIFDVYPETATKLKQEAQANAYEDALAQFSVFKKRCPFTDERLVGVSEPQYEVMPRMRMMSAAVADISTPIIPDAVVYQARWRFEWSYLAPTGCVPLPEAVGP